jgi:hypothetical protein
MLSWFLLVNDTIFVNLPTSGLIYPNYNLPDLSNGGYVFSNMIAEPLGAFFVTFFYLTQTEEKTMFSKEKAINCFIIASAYVGARGMLAGRTNCLAG